MPNNMFRLMIDLSNKDYQTRTRALDSILEYCTENSLIITDPFMIQAILDLFDGAIWYGKITIADICVMCTNLEKDRKLEIVEALKKVNIWHVTEHAKGLYKHLTTIPR